MSTQQPGWLPDPAGRHEQRYWDGRGWTDHVADHGVASLDPLTPQPPPQLPGSGYGYPSGPYGLGGPRGPGGPPRRGSSKAPLVIAVVVLLAAVGGGAALLVANSGGGEDDEKRREYADAMVVAMQDDDERIPVSESEAECLVDAELDIIGLRAISDAVTPEEIRESPGDGLSEWGIEPSRDQRLDLLDSLESCVDDLGAVFAESMVPSDMEIDVEEVGACLADGFDDEDIRVLLAESIMTGDDQDLTEEQADVAFDWIAGCIDFRAVFVEYMAQEVDEDIAQCVGDGLTDDWIRGSLTAEFTGDEEAGEEFDAELQEVVEDCTASGEA